MPLLRLDLMEGRTDEELKTLLDATHDAVVKAFGVPRGGSLSNCSATSKQ